MTTKSSKRGTKSRTKPRAATRPAAKSRTSPAGPVSPEYLLELRALIDLVNETGISELEVQSTGRTFRIGRNGTAGAGHAPVASAPAAAPAMASAPAAVEPETARLVAIKSPLVGTFYRAPAPDADPYMEEGQRVSVGATACIIEAMKLMNEIQSEVAGKVVRVCVQNGHPVEYGQDLFLVDPGA